MRFQVPQFIEVEDKVFGPLTIKQFIFLAGGAGISFLVYVIIGNFILSIIPIILIMGLSGTLAFYKVNKRPFILIMESAFRYFFGPKLYIWKKEEKPVSPKEKEEKEMRSYASIMVPKISNSKLKDLTWSLDIKESMYSNKNQK
jgi:hypothetical protein